MENRVLLLVSAIVATAVGSYALLGRLKRSQGQTSPSKAGKSKKSVTFVLEKGHVEWLKDMARKHNLPDDGKELRVLLSYAKNDGDSDAIFTKIRCIQCGKKDKVAKQFTIEEAHEAYLKAVVNKYKLPDMNKAVRILIDFAKSEGDEDLIYEVKRCAHGATCQRC